MAPEAWLSDIVEWIWYTNSEHFRKLKLEGRLWTLEALGAWVRKRVQKQTSTYWPSRFGGFVGRESPISTKFWNVRARICHGRGAFGEMVLNVGKVVYLAKKGAAGIIDISPFTCMNGIVCEAIYPRISRGSWVVYRSAISTSTARSRTSIGIWALYMELARTYRKKVA